MRPGTHSVFCCTQRILKDGSGMGTEKQNRVFMQITNSRKKQRRMICKFVFRENNFYQLIDSSQSISLKILRLKPKSHCVV